MLRDRLQQGFFLSAAPLAALIALGAGSADALGRLRLPLALMLSLLAFSGAWLLDRRPGSGRLLISSAVLATAVLALVQRVPSPLAVLTAFAAGTMLLAWIWGWTLPTLQGKRPGARARGSAWGSVFVCLFVLFAGGIGRQGTIAVYAALLIAAIASRRAFPAALHRHAVLLIALAALVASLLVHGAPLFGVLLALGASFALLSFAGRWAVDEDAGPAAHWSSFVYADPARLLVLSFLALVAGGTALLALPHAASDERSIGMVDALFTSTSAVCVTGLIVRDTPRDFGRFGQAMILLLIQLGGLGIMIFSVAAMAIAGRRLSVRQETAAMELVGTFDRRRVTGAARVVLLVTFVCELVGALVLFALFALGGDSVGSALWRGLFTAISAFCNAGFALQTDSLVPYQGNVPAMLVVAVLIVLGGLGPAVVLDIPRAVRRKPGVALSVKLVLWTTVVLLAPFAIFILVAEWGHALRRLSPAARLGNALFQAVTPRTAGFNTLDMTALRPVTIWLTMGLMFVGGSPASTAGGIKTTTAALLTLMIHAALMGRTQIRVFGRRVPERSVYRAAAVATLGALTVAAIVVLLQLTQQLSLEHSLFETISALGTVGLSLGATALLDSVGKLLITVTMFAGRVGPLSLFMVLSARAAADRAVLPEEDVLVG